MMSRFLRISLMIGLFFLLVPAAAINGQQSVTPSGGDIPYGESDRPGLKLDVYVPQIGTSPYPVVVMFNDSDGKDEFVTNGLVADVTKLGYAVVAMDYAPKVPQGYSDGFCALAWVYENAQQFNLDTGRIALLGDALGGMIAEGMVAIVDPTPYMTNCPNALPSNHPIRGVITNSGPFFSVVDMYPDAVGSGYFPDLDNVPSAALRQALDTLRATPFDQWSTLQFSADVQAAFDDYPIFRVHSHEPPHLLIQGLHDESSPYQDTLNYAQALLEQGDSVQLVLDPPSGQVVDLSVYKDAMAAFLKDIFA